MCCTFVARGIKVLNIVFVVLGWSRMHASCHCLVLSEKICLGAFLCMAVANPTIGRNLLHVDCDGAVSIRFLSL